MRGARLLSSAERDLLDASGYLEGQRPGLSERFLTNVQIAVQRVGENPNQGPSVSASYRKLRVRRFPYSLIYRIEPSEVLIVAVAHHRRRPNYWETPQ